MRRKKQVRRGHGVELVRKLASEGIRVFTTAQARSFAPAAGLSDGYFRQALHTRLQEARNRLGIPWQVIERDYLLSWMLAGVDQMDSLRETLVLKGGSAVKKCYFGDYYDLWRVLGTYKSRMELTGFESFLREKCAVRNVSFKEPGDFFQEAMLTYVEKSWDQWLGPLVPDLPPHRAITGELRQQIEDLLASRP